MRPVSRLVALCVLLAGMLPWALALASVRDPGIAVVFHSLGHQLPERTLSIVGVPMLVCSRCAGIYAGIVTAGGGS